MTARSLLPEAIARCVLADSAPPELRAAMARGMVPVPPVVRLSVLTILVEDPEGAVRNTAHEAWNQLLPSLVDDALADRSLPGEVLDFVAKRSATDPDRVLQVLDHPNVLAATLARFVESEVEEILERVANNHRVLQGAPELARHLLDNPHLHPEQRGKLVSLFAPEAAAAEPDGALVAQDGADFEELPETLRSDDVPAEADNQNLYKLIQGLSVADKVKLANLGSKSARRLLIRDTNKIVLTAVIRSPKIGEDEVVNIAQDKAMPEDVIRHILLRRDWMKSYPIRLGLAQNPKTPIPKALRLLETLQDRDLRSLAKSKNVARPIAANAMRILVRRGKT